MKNRSLILAIMFVLAVSVFGFTLQNDDELVGKGSKLDIIVTQDGKEVTDTVYLHDIGTFAFLSRYETLPIPIKVKSIPSKDVLKSNGMITKKDIVQYERIIKFKDKTIRKSFYLQDTGFFTFTSIYKKLRIDMPEGQIPSRETLQRNGMNYSHAMGSFLDEKCSCLDRGNSEGENTSLTPSLENDPENPFADRFETSVSLDINESHFCPEMYYQVCVPGSNPPDCWCEWCDGEPECDPHHHKN